MRLYAAGFRALCLMLADGFAWVALRDVLAGGPMLAVGPLAPLLRLGLAGCAAAFLGVTLGLWPPRARRRTGPGTRSVGA